MPGITSGKKPAADVDQLRELDDMFMDQGDSFQMPPPEWPDLVENRAPKVSVAHIPPTFGEESLLRDIERDITGATTPGEPLTPAAEAAREILVATEEEVAPLPPEEVKLI